MELSERIQNLRRQRRLSQEELAEALGVSRQAVSKWESGQSLPEVDKIVLLSKKFCVSTDYLLMGKQSVEGQGFPVEKEQDGARVGLLYGAAFFIGLLLGLLCRHGLALGWPASMAIGACVFLILGQLFHARELRGK